MSLEKDTRRTKEERTRRTLPQSTTHHQLAAHVSKCKRAAHPIKLFVSGHRLLLPRKIPRELFETFGSIQPATSSTTFRIITTLHITVHIASNPYVTDFIYCDWPLQMIAKAGSPTKHCSRFEVLPPAKAILLAWLAEYHRICSEASSTPTARMRCRQHSVLELASQQYFSHLLQRTA